MRRLRIAVVDLVAKGPTHTLYQHMMNANFASVMPQAIAVWCEADGHEVTYVCYTGGEDLEREIPDEVDVVFVSAYTESALLAYALSHRLRSRGVVTVLGGPHARCYPEDGRSYFDVVVGFADRELVRDLLADASPHHPVGLLVSASSQPRSLPGVRQRWKFVQAALRKCPWFRIVPMLGSVGCPYTCDFCIDSVVPYRAFDLEETKEDLRFLVSAVERPLVGWHDPNFGVRFDETMDAIEEAVPPGRVGFLAESSLSLLSDRNLARLQRNNFRAMLPGVESWFDFGNKSRTGALRGMAKVRAVADHVNRVVDRISYVVVNFLFATDQDAGDEPFALTRRFLELAPAAHPSLSLLVSYGRAAPANLGYQRAGRVVPIPFQVLHSGQVTNVVPRHYDWPGLHRRIGDLFRHSFSLPSVARRLFATRQPRARLVHAMRALSNEGRGMSRHHERFRRLYATDRGFRGFFDRTTTKVPDVYRRRIRRELGSFWRWLPPGAIEHDPAAYLAAAPSPVRSRPDAAVAR